MMLKKNLPVKRIACLPLLLAVVVVFFLVSTTGCTKTHDVPPVPRATHGELDLRNYSLMGDVTVPLNGEWEFYWGQLLTPDDFLLVNHPPQKTGFFSFPGSWTGYHLGEHRLGAYGKATFRLKIITDQNFGRLTLRIIDVHEAYTLWANGKVVAESGVPGNSIQTEMPARSLVLAELPLQGKPLDLVLQVSNHHFRFGGVTEPILVARPGPLENARTRYWGLSLFLAGSLVIMGVYHLALFYWLRNDPVPLYFGFYCLLIVGYCVTSNSSYWVASIVWPWWNPGVVEVFSLSCFVIWPSLMFRFLKTLYPDEFHSVILYFLDGRIVVFFIMLLFVPFLFVYWFVAFCLLETFFCSVYYYQRLIVCIRRGHNGAKMFLAGLSLQFVAGINDPLVHLGIIKSIYLVQPAVFFFVLFQSFVLAKRFSSSFHAVEELSVELERKNKSLQIEIETRNRLEQKIVDVSEEERRQLSNELHDSLCQQLTGARLRASALVHTYEHDANAQELKELAEILKISTREAYKIARGLWPVEHGNTGPSLENLASSIAKATGITVRFEKHPHCEKCSNSNLTSLYRIAQEALANAAKHAHAHNIEVHLQCAGDGCIVLTVLDDGVGYSSSDFDEGGLGTSIMSHRAKIMGATLRIDNNTPQGGTKLTCVAPCESTKATCVDSNEN